jgi:TetR/AcrR family transcriptional regulator, copper-responsive repressor
MVQNKESKRRGRPRAYDPQAALQQATDRFWRTGYSGTSLDEISAAVGMNRPSLYAAFGDKRALYIKALEHYWQLSVTTMQKALTATDQPLHKALMDAYEAQLSIYFPDGDPPLGCFAIGTATTEAVDDPVIRTILADGLRTLDSDLEARIRLARDKGEVKTDADPAALALLASATLHSMAIRARAGFSRDELRCVARKAVSVICGRSGPSTD